MFYDAIHAKTTKGFVSHLIKYSDHFKFEFGVVKFFSPGDTVQNFLWFAGNFSWQTPRHSKAHLRF